MHVCVNICFLPTIKGSVYSCKAVKPGIYVPTVLKALPPPQSPRARVEPICVPSDRNAFRTWAAFKEVYREEWPGAQSLKQPAQHHAVFQRALQKALGVRHALFRRLQHTERDEPRDRLLGRIHDRKRGRIRVLEIGARAVRSPQTIHLLLFFSPARVIGVVARGCDPSFFLAAVCMTICLGLSSRGLVSCSGAFSNCLAGCQSDPPFSFPFLSLSFPFLSLSFPVTEVNRRKVTRLWRHWQLMQMKICFQCCWW